MRTEIRVHPLPRTGDGTLYSISWQNLPSPLVHQKTVSIGHAVPRALVAKTLAKELWELSKQFEQSEEYI